MRWSYRSSLRRSRLSVVSGMDELVSARGGWGRLMEQERQLYLKIHRAQRWANQWERVRRVLRSLLAGRLWI